jgi:hypothetical protein
MKPAEPVTRIDTWTAKCFRARCAVASYGAPGCGGIKRLERLPKGESRRSEDKSIQVSDFGSFPRSDERT